MQKTEFLQVVYCTKLPRGKGEVKDGREGGRGSRGGGREVGRNFID